MLTACLKRYGGRRRGTPAACPLQSRLVTRCPFFLPAKLGEGSDPELPPRFISCSSPEVKEGAASAVPHGTRRGGGRAAGAATDPRGGGQCPAAPARPPPAGARARSRGSPLASAAGRPTAAPGGPHDEAGPGRAGPARWRRSSRSLGTRSSIAARGRPLPANGRRQGARAREARPPAARGDGHPPQSCRAAGYEPRPALEPSPAAVPCSRHSPGAHPRPRPPRPPPPPQRGASADVLRSSEPRFGATHGPFEGTLLMLVSKN